MSQTPEQSIQAIDSIIREVQKIPQKVELFAANEMHNTITVRVFSDLRNTDGKSLGKYKSKGWILKRKEAGRQTNVRDLNFTGNLFIAFKVGEENGKAVVGFTDGADISLDNYSPKSKPSKKKKKGAKKIIYPGTAKLSELIEENLDMVIFSPNRSEVDQVIRNTNKFAIGLLDKAVNTFLK